MTGPLCAALVKAGAGEDDAKRTAEEVAIFEFRITGLEKKIDRLDARVDAKFTVFSWMIGVNMALTIAILGLLLPASGVR